jgi:hypothetical protein
VLDLFSDPAVVMRLPQTKFGVVIFDLIVFFCLCLDAVEASKEEHDVAIGEVI